MKKIKKKKRIPVGIFFLLLFVLLILSAGISSLYFYYVAGKNITEIEERTKNYSTTIAEASAHIAELSFRSGDYSKLKRLFMEKIQENDIDRAFFVLANGKIIVHSDPDAVKKLYGNIANDEFAYNLDQILLPLRLDPDKTHFADYNIISNKVPFDKIQRRILKKYLYSKIDIVGWIANRAVIINGKPAGTVNLIISKERIYNFLFMLIEESINLIIILSIASFAITFLISFILFFRYRSISGTAADIVKPVKVTEDKMAGIIEFNRDKKVIDMPDGDFLVQKLDPESLEKNKSERSKKVVKVLFEERKKIDTEKPIKDAIPIRRNG